MLWSIACLSDEGLQYLILKGETAADLRIRGAKIRAYSHGSLRFFVAQRISFAEFS